MQCSSHLKHAFCSFATSSKEANELSGREQHLEHFIALFMASGQFARREKRQRREEGESGDWPIPSSKLEIENFNALFMASGQFARRERRQR